MWRTIPRSRILISVSISMPHRYTQEYSTRMIGNEDFFWMKITLRHFQPMKCLQSLLFLSSINSCCDKAFAAIMKKIIFTSLLYRWFVKKFRMLSLSLHPLITVTTCGSFTWIKIQLISSPILRFNQVVGLKFPNSIV